MTEEEWLACRNARLMRRFLASRMTGRKYRLLICTLREVNWPDERSAAAIAIAERYADGLASEEEVERAREEAQLAAERWRIEGPLHNHVYALAASHAVDEFDAAFFVQLAQVRPFDERPGPMSQEELECCRIRDIFGNPFHPVSFAEEWRTETAVALARRMYESHDFSAMPTLADLLQDAGCDNDDILSHCRGEGPHVRGCWVVDLVLGKE